MAGERNRPLAQLIGRNVMMMMMKKKKKMNS